MKNQNARTLSLFVAGLVLFLPLFVSAQPGGSPPAGNIDANFDSVRIDGDLEFYNPLLGWPFANFTIFATGDMQDQDSGVQVTDTQGFSVFDDSGLNEWFRIGGNGIVSNPSTANNGKVLLSDPDGVQLSPYFEVSSGGAVSNEDPVQNNGTVFVEDDEGMRVASTASNVNTSLDLRGRLTNESGTIYSGVVAVDDADGFGVWDGSSYPGYTSQPGFKVYGDGAIGSPGLTCGNPPTCSFFVNIPLTLSDNDGVEIANDAGTVGLQIEADGDIIDPSGNVTVRDDLEVINDLIIPADDTQGVVRMGTDALIHNHDDGSDYSLFMGIDAGNFTNSGNSNTAFGVDTLSSIGGALSNVAVGTRALEDAIWSEGSTAVGAFAASNSTGWPVTAIGWSALYFNTTGGANVAVGDVAMYYNTTGSGNTAVGSSALVDNISGGENTAVGHQALNNKTSGNNNVGIGSLAGYNNVSGSGNIFIGRQAGYSESGSNKLYIDNSSTTTPLIKGDFSSNRIDIHGELYANPTGSGAYGIRGYGSTAGGYFDDTNNDGYAYLANGDAGLRGYGSSYGIYGNETDTGSYAYSGYSGYGSYAQGSTGGGYFRDSNNGGVATVGVGYRGIDATGTSSGHGGTFRNGSIWVDIASSTRSITTNDGRAYKPGGGSWYVWSDERLKDVRGDYGKGLKDILQLNPVEYNYKKDNALDTPSDKDYVGFIAQDVQEVFPEAVAMGEKGYLTLDMHPVSVAVINAIKDIVSMIDTETAVLRAEIDDQRKEIAELKEIVCDIKPEHANCN